MTGPQSKNVTSIDSQRPSIDNLNSAISKIRTRIEELKEIARGFTVKQKDNDGDRIREEHKHIRAEIERMRVCIDEKKREQDVLRQQIHDIDTQKAELRKKQVENDKQPFTTEADIDAEIRQLEFKLETGRSSSLKREGQIMNNIKRLQYSKKFIKQKQDLTAEIDSFDNKRKTLFEQVQSIQQEIEGLRTKRSELYLQVQNMQMKQTAGKDSAALLRQERQQVSDSIAQCFEEIRILREKFSEDMDEWKRKRDEEREKEIARKLAVEKARQDKWKAQQEERQAREDEKIRAQKEFNRLKRLNPHEDEIVTCEILIQYLSNENSHKEKPRPVQNFNAAAFAKPGMQQFKRTAAEEDAWLMGSKKKKNTTPKQQEPKSTKQPAPNETPVEPPVPKSKADRVLPAMPVAKLQAFDKLRITPPVRQSEVPACVEELRKKKAHFESFIKTIEQVIAEEEIEDARRQDTLLRQQALKEGQQTYIEQSAESHTEAASSSPRNETTDENYVDQPSPIDINSNNDEEISGGIEGVNIELSGSQNMISTEA